MVCQVALVTTHQSPLVASQAEVAARVVASPFRLEQEESNEGVGGVSNGWRIVHVPPDQPLSDDVSSHECHGYPVEVDGTAAGDVKGAKPAEEAGAIPEPAGECVVHEDTLFDNKQVGHVPDRDLCRRLIDF